MTRRTKLAVAAVALAGLAVPPAVAVNAEQGLDVTMSPRKAGTTKKPNASSLKIALTTTPKDDTAFATTSATIYFDRHVVFSTSRFPTCTRAQVQRDPTRCRRGSKVGTGTAQGRALGQVQHLSVVAYNGPKQTINLLVRGSTPLQIDSVIVGKLRRASGRYGKKLVVAIPENLQEPVHGVYATLTSFITKISRRTSRGRPYVGLKGCPRGGLRFRATLTFTDGDSRTANDTVPCARR